MVEFENNIIPEPNSAYGFRELVLETQHLWKEHRRGIKAISESVDLPLGFSSWFHKLMLDHLPDYVKDLRPSLEKSHPPPIFSMGYTLDKRILTLPRYEMSRYIPEESGVDENQFDEWVNGMVLLYEFASDSLAVEILNAILPKKFSRGDIDLYPKDNLFATGSMTNESVKKLSAMFGSFEKFRIFQRSLVRGSLLCDDEDINNVLASYNTNIDKLAAEIGKTEKYHTKREFASEEEAKEYFTERALGLVDVTIPGIITFPLRIPVIAAIVGAAGPSSSYLLAELQKDVMKNPYIANLVQTLGLLYIPAIIADLIYVIQLPRIFAHEWVHYIMMDFENIGLTPYKFEEEETNDE